MAQIDVVSSRDGESTTVVPNHRHCQSTVCAAAGHQEDGSTWGEINNQNNFTNLPSNWKDNFASNISSQGKNNITYDFVAILQILNQVAGDIKNSQFTPFNVEFQDNHGNHLDQFTADNNGGTKRVILGKDIELKIDGMTAWKFNTLGSLAEGSSGGSDSSGSGTDTQIFNLQSKNFSFSQDYNRCVKSNTYNTTNNVQSLEDGIRYETDESELIEIDGTKQIYFLQKAGTYETSGVNASSNHLLRVRFNIPQKYLSGQDNIRWELRVQNTSGAFPLRIRDFQVMFNNQLQSGWKYFSVGAPDLMVPAQNTKTYQFDVEFIEKTITWKVVETIDHSRCNATSESDCNLRPSSGSEEMNVGLRNTYKKEPDGLGGYTYDYLQMHTDINAIFNIFNDNEYICPNLATIDGSRYVYRIKFDGSDEWWGFEKDSSGTQVYNEDGTPSKLVKKLVYTTRISSKYLTNKGILEWEVHVENSTDDTILSIHPKPMLLMDGANFKILNEAQIILKTNDFMVGLGQVNVYKFRVDTNNWVVTVDLAYKYWSNSSNFSSNPIIDVNYQAMNDKNLVEQNTIVLKKTPLSEAVAKWEEENPGKAPNISTLLAYGDEPMMIDGSHYLFRAVRNADTDDKDYANGMYCDSTYHARCFVNQKYVSRGEVEWELHLSNTGTQKLLKFDPTAFSILGVGVSKYEVVPSSEMPEPPNDIGLIRSATTRAGGQPVMIDNSERKLTPVKPGYTNVYKFRRDLKNRRLIISYQYSYKNHILADGNSASDNPWHWEVMNEPFDTRKNECWERMAVHYKDEWLYPETPEPDIQEEKINNDIFILNPEYRIHYKCIREVDLQNLTNNMFTFHIFSRRFSVNDIFQNYVSPGVFELEAIICNQTNGPLEVHGLGVSPAPQYFDGKNANAGPLYDNSNTWINKTISTRMYSYASINNFSGKTNPGNLPTTSVIETPVTVNNAGRFQIPKNYTGRFIIRGYAPTNQLVVSYEEVFLNTNFPYSHDTALHGANADGTFDPRYVSNANYKASSNDNGSKVLTAVLATQPLS